MLAKILTFENIAFGICGIQTGMLVWNKLSTTGLSLVLSFGLSSVATALAFLSLKSLSAPPNNGGYNKDKSKGLFAITHSLLTGLLIWQRFDLNTGLATTLMHIEKCFFWNMPVISSICWTASWIDPQLTSLNLIFGSKSICSQGVGGFIVGAISAVSLYMHYMDVNFEARALMNIPGISHAVNALSAGIQLKKSVVDDGMDKMMLSALKIENGAVLYNGMSNLHYLSYPTSDHPYNIQNIILYASVLFRCRS